MNETVVAVGVFAAFTGLLIPAVVVLRLTYRLVQARQRRARLREHAKACPTLAATQEWKPPARPYRMMCVLGSGGHTAEMLSLLGDLFASPSDHAGLSGITFIATSSDDHSLKKARRFHMGLLEKRKAQAADLGDSGIPEATYCSIHRAREVGQGWISTVGSSLRCIVSAIPLVVRANANVCVVNGPGSSVLVVAIVLLLNAIGFSRTQCIYVESVARTRTLSLSGKILYHIVDRFIVQWPRLAELYSLAEYHGRLC